MTFPQRVYCLVRRVPAGRVVSYGMVAAALGESRKARQVGYALHMLAADTDVPWHRVINSQGAISIRGDDIRARVQRERLIAEGVVFDGHGRTSFQDYGYGFSVEDLAACGG